MNIISSDVRHEFKISRSVFITHLHPESSLNEIKDYISSISKQYKDANHNCWAYIAGDQAQMQHSSDAGEPSGTAGRPMLNILKKHELTNIVAVVTRYFGGVKLGIRGLIEAYSQSIEEALSRTDIFPLIERKEFIVLTGYEYIEILKYNLLKLEAEISSIEYGEKIEMKISIISDRSGAVEDYLLNLEAAGNVSLKNG